MNLLIDNLDPNSIHVLRGVEWTFEHEAYLHELEIEAIKRGEITPYDDLPF